MKICRKSHRFYGSRGTPKRRCAFIPRYSGIPRLRLLPATTDEIDYYWEKLTAGGDEKAQICGWLKDRYGVSWQIVPTVLGELLKTADPEKSRNAMKALLGMKKIDMEALKRAAGRQRAA